MRAAPVARPDCKRQPDISTANPVAGMSLAPISAADIVISIPSRLTAPEIGSRSLLRRKRSLDSRTVAHHNTVWWSGVPVINLSPRRRQMRCFMAALPAPNSTVTSSPRPSGRSPRVILAPIRSQMALTIASPSPLLAAHRCVECGRTARTPARAPRPGYLDHCPRSPAG